MLEVANKDQRSIFGAMVKRLWEERDYPMGRWVYSYVSDGGPILITTSIHAKDRMRFEVLHPLYKAFVVYG